MAGGARTGTTAAALPQRSPASEPVRPPEAVEPEPGLRDLPRLAQPCSLVGVDPGRVEVAGRRRTQRGVQVEGATEAPRACGARHPEEREHPVAGRRPEIGVFELSHLEGQYVAFGGAIAATPEMGEHGHADAVRYTDLLAPWTNGREYLNFAETPVDVRSAYADGVWQQLSGIRSAVDPHGNFVANHPVPRLFEDGRRRA